MKNCLAVMVAVVLAGCQTTDEYRSYTPHPGTVHSLYPFQFEGRPQTANELLQVKSRGEYSMPAYSCLVGDSAINVVGHMVMILPFDKKEWPRFGYLVRSTEKSKAADGSSNYKAYFEVDGVAWDKRNDLRDVYRITTMMLGWNDEKRRDGWMHGAMEIRADAVHGNGKIQSLTVPPRHNTEAKCMILDPDRSVQLSLRMAVSTMTPQQKAHFTSSSP